MLKKTVLAFKVKIIVPKIVRQELQFDKVGLKTPSPNNQGLNFLLHVQFRQVLKNCVKASRARIPGKQAGIPGKQARIREERFYLITGHSLFFCGLVCPGMAKQKCGTVNQNKNAHIFLQARI